MLPKKNLILLSLPVLAALVICLVWYFNPLFIQNRIISLINPVPILPAGNLTADNIKKMPKYAELSPIKQPLIIQDKKIAEVFKDSVDTVYYRGDNSDTTGRTYLVADKNLAERGAVGFGAFRVEKFASVSGQRKMATGVIKEVGIFDEFINIPDSPDYYLLLSVPGGQEKFIIRANLNAKNPQFCAQSYEGMTTNLLVQNFDISRETYNTPTKFAALGSLSLYSYDDLNKILQRGDVVTVWNNLWPDFYWPKYNILGLNRTDSSGFYCAKGLIIGRFGGKEEIEKELGRTINSFETGFLNYIENLYLVKPK